MSDLDQLVKQLSDLSEDDLIQVMDLLTVQRVRTAPAADKRASFAEWLAKRHLGFDNRLTEVVYLPSGAPEREVRLLEVNTGLYPDPRDDAIVPVELTPAIAGLPFRVYVADVTPAEWVGLRDDQLKLPTGWRLDGYRKFGRRKV